jgi:hypothetical protein
MVARSVAPSGRKPYHYYVCLRKVEESWQVCPNRCHRAEILEQRVRRIVCSIWHGARR